MKYKILIGCMLCLFSFIPKGAANLVLNPYTSQEISADSIIERVMTFAPSYESIVSDYRANLYIKGKMNIQKKSMLTVYSISMKISKKSNSICLMTIWLSKKALTALL